MKLGKPGQSLEDLEANGSDDEDDNFRLRQSKPTAPAAPLQEASRLRRLIAFVLDALIEVAVIVAIIFVLGGGRPSRTDQLLYRDAGFGALFMTLLQSYVIALSGQSFGKMICGIRIANLYDDAVPDFSRTVFIRYWLPMAVSYSIPFAVIIDVLCILGRERRCLHDLLAGTRVVQL